MSWFTKYTKYFNPPSRDCSIHPEHFTEAQWEELIAYTHDTPEFPYALYRMNKTPRRSGFKLEIKDIGLRPEDPPVEWYDPYGPWQKRTCTGVCPFIANPERIPATGCKCSRMAYSKSQETGRGVPWCEYIYRDPEEKHDP